MFHTVSHIRFESQNHAVSNIRKTRASQGISYSSEARIPSSSLYIARRTHANWTFFVAMISTMENQKIFVQAVDDSTIIEPETSGFKFSLTCHVRI